MMLPTSIGLPTDRRGNLTFDLIQDDLYRRGLTPYMPQLRYGRTYNLGMGYDHRTKGMYGQEHPYGWSPAMIAETARFQHPMVFLWGYYWYLDRPDVLRWGDGLTVDGCSFEQLTEYLGNTLRWFHSVGIPDPWIGVDEPPHHVIYGWTQALEDRVVKFITAATNAGWTVGVIHPNPTAYAYWRDRIHPKRVILNDRASAAEYGKIEGECWLYNAPATKGLRGRLAAIGGSGYLTWTATDDIDVEPLFTIRVNDVKPTPALLTLVDELEDAYEPPLPTFPETWQKGYADHEARLRKLGV